MTERDWRRHGAFYQIYPRSFADGNGDGTGDIAGIRQRLPHVVDLGVDGVWISPWYPSPLADGGYDVADHTGIHPLFGTLDQAGLLLEEAAACDLRVLVDLVPNHTSTAHPWFRAAVDAAPGTPERQRYHILPGRGPGGGRPPNNWESAFGGPAWTRLPGGEWYLHLFDSSQPDLNWTDPRTRDAFDEAMRHWIDLGVDGFRVDAVQCVAKDPAYPDWRGEPGSHHLSPGEVHPYRGRQELHEIARHWRRLLDADDRELMMVGEVIVSPWDRLAEFLRPGEFHQVFDFGFLETPWDRDRLRAQIHTSIEAATAVGALPTWVLSNHDVVRPVTRYGLPADVDPARWLLGGDRSLLDESLGRRRARALAMVAMALPGGYFLYQGEELGLPEVHGLPLDAVEDPVFERSGRTLKGRDGCRVPIPWTRTGPSCGFGGDGAWLPQPEGWRDYAAAAQAGRAGSTLELYRRCLAVRTDELANDEFEWLDVDHALAFGRGDVVCITNFAAVAIDLPPGEVLASSDRLAAGALPPDATVWLRTGSRPRRGAPPPSASGRTP